MTQAIIFYCLLLCEDPTIQILPYFTKGDKVSLDGCKLIRYGRESLIHTRNAGEKPGRGVVVGDALVFEPFCG